MYISRDLFLYFDLAVIAIFLLFVIIGYINGLLYQLVTFAFNVLSAFAAYFLAPIFRTRFMLLKMEGVYSIFDPFINDVLYFVIIFIILKIICLFLKPLLKGVSKIPLIGLINKAGGAIVGAINGILIILLLGVLLNTPLIGNGAEVKNNTLFKYGKPITDFVVKEYVSKIDFNELSDEYNNFNIDEKRELLVNWLIEQGIINE